MSSWSSSSESLLRLLEADECTYSGDVNGRETLGLGEVLADGVVPRTPVLLRCSKSGKA